MSGSPKYTSYSLSYDAEQAVAAQRARQADLERARRIAEEERRRQQRLAAARVDADSLVDRLQRHAASLVTGDLAAHLVGDPLEVSASLAVIRRDIGAATAEGDISRLRAHAEGLSAELARIEARARAAKLAADLDAESGVATEMEYLLGTLDEDVARRFDLAGAQACQHLLEELTEAIARERLADARGLSAQARRAVDAHLGTVRERYDDWRARRDQALLEIATVADCVAASQADEVCARWAGAQLSELVNELAPLDVTAESDHPDDVHPVCDSVLVRIAELTAEAQRLQLAEERRQVMVKGLIATMDRMSFTLQKGYPNREDESDLASTVRLQARRRADRKAFDVTITIDGDVAYEIDGFPQRLETAPDGNPAATCDEAEQQIEAFHAMLEHEFGVQSDGLRWQDRNPQRTLNSRKQLPASQPARRTAFGR